MWQRTCWYTVIFIYYLAYGVIFCTSTSTCLRSADGTPHPLCTVLKTWCTWSSRYFSCCPEGLELGFAIYTKSPTQDNFKKLLTPPDSCVERIVKILRLELYYSFYFAIPIFGANIRIVFEYSVPSPSPSESKQHWLRCRCSRSFTIAVRTSSVEGTEMCLG
jgi:hypothetical protein